MALHVATGVGEQGAEQNVWTEVTGGWGKLLNEQLHNLYSSSSAYRMAKPRMRWVGHVA
jgi:hypothetical protein